jgi:hypothetical protein
LLDDDRGVARKVVMPGVLHRFDANQTGAKRARHHHERAGAAHELFGEIRHAAGPGERPVRRVVDGDTGRPGLLLLERG